MRTGFSQLTQEVVQHQLGRVVELIQERAIGWQFLPREFLPHASPSGSLLRTGALHPSRLPYERIERILDMNANYIGVM